LRNPAATSPDRLLAIRIGTRANVDGSVDRWPTLVVYSIQSTVLAGVTQVDMQRTHHTSRMVAPLLWWQWDAEHQTLFVLRPTMTVGLLAGEVELAALVCKQGVLVETFKTSLPLPEVMAAVHASTLLDVPLATQSVWSHVQLAVVLLDDGAVCLCRQVRRPDVTG
jgi:hypothetical protein